MDKSLSKSFAMLRYPLALLVVYLHIDANPSLYLLDIFNQSEPVYHLIKVIFVLLAKLAVPSFFLMSGFLFFIKHQTFSSSDYLRVIRKKIRKLLIPFIVWNIFAVVYLYVTQNKILDSFVSVFIVPANFPLWFLKNLIILFFCYPLVLLVIKLKWIGFVGLSVFYIVCSISNLLHIYTYSSIFFFTLGGFWAIYGETFFKRIADKYVYLNLLTTLFFFTVLLYNGTMQTLLENVYIMIGCLSLFVFSFNWCKSDKYCLSAIWGDASFFIYLSHKVGFTALSKFCFSWLPSCELSFIIRFIFAPILTTLFSILVYKLLIRYFQSSFGWLVGK